MGKENIRMKKREVKSGEDKTIKEEEEEKGDSEGERDEKMTKKERGRKEK